jgi:hypothetical protein
MIVESKFRMNAIACDPVRGERRLLILKNAAHIACSHFWLNTLVRASFGAIRPFVDEKEAPLHFGMEYS